MSEKFTPISGNEFQVEGFQIAIRSAEETESGIEAAVSRLQSVFRGETAHKIVRVNYQRGKKSFIFNAGFEETLYNEIVDWMKETAKREYYPVVFEFRNFLSFSPPTLV